MSHSQGERTWNPWKVATIAISLVFTTALVTGVVVAKYVGGEKTDLASEPPAPAQPPDPGQQAAPPVPPPPDIGVPPTPIAPPAPPHHAKAEASAADIAACNRWARKVSHNRTQETLTDGILGSALGAGLGAASGAIAGGGGGAGKGAGIGALVGAAGGTLYGLNQANQHDARAAEAYRSCMRERGYSD